MRKGGRQAILAAAVLVGGAAGWWFTRTAIDEATPDPVAAVQVPKAPLYDPPPKASKPAARPVGWDRDDEAAEAGALKNQRSIVFSSREAMEKFLAAAQGKGIAILGSIDRLNALHVGFLSLDDLMALLDGTEDTGFIYPVSLPTPTTEGVQEGAIGFGNQLLAWLGITGDNSAYGAGVKIAILDTGSTLAGAKNFFLVDPPADASGWNGHGTAVADLIRQIAPSSELLSWRVADDNGVSNSFLLAQGILAAVDSGVDIINISMGSYGNSTILRQAVEYAQSQGIIIYASTGNEGYDQIAYPAGYSGVVGVGAVDAAGNHLNFSNTGDVSMSAPGLDLVTAWTGDQSIYFTGTSASSPIGVGVLAATMSSGGTKITSASAYQKVVDNLNESGAPGTDEYYGDGTVDFGRILNSSQSGITDAAIASNYITTGANGQPVLQVTVENRGTATLINAPVQVTINGSTTTYYVTTLQAGDIKTFTVPVSTQNGQATIVSGVSVSGGTTDSKPANNKRSDVYVSPPTN
ncbi:S8 family serine peptidase [Luteolibacter flavescens]|uniref:S8 family serine peptidase n=1 Tax=Luteolibacter flavescens TaxID=1859460 RepID=A0ABT3FIV1_9BACT|nr:S8 family serine peptidase [Luteolibacter flavescens]MCW1883206.1 S8 family serine peptidase [Luteolibacter flavescens]